MSQSTELFNQLVKILRDSYQGGAGSYDYARFQQILEENGMAKAKQRKFDPGDIDWASLSEMYSDDPLLSELFESMQDYVATPGFKNARYWSVPTSWTTPNFNSTTPVSISGTYLTNNTVSVKPSMTLTYDGAGNYVLVED